MAHLQIYMLIYDVEITIGDRILVFVEHLVEGVVQLSRDRIDLQLLPNDLVLQLVNPEKRNQ